MELDVNLDILKMIGRERLFLELRDQSLGLRK